MFFISRLGGAIVGWAAQCWLVGRQLPQLTPLGAPGVRPLHRARMSARRGVFPET